MRNTGIILLGLGILMLAYASTRSSGRHGRTWLPQLKGWQKVFGVIAVVLTFLILLNPDFLALGLLGDTTFFDMFVLALTLQLHLYATRAYRAVTAVLSRGVRRLGIPSPGFSFLLAAVCVIVGDAVSTVHKAVDRFFS
jgi:hypothetical protein